MGHVQVLLLRKDIAPAWYHQLWPDVVAAAGREDGVVLVRTNRRLRGPVADPDNPAWLDGVRIVAAIALSLYFQNDAVPNDTVRALLRVVH